MVLALKMYSDNTNGLLYHLFKEKCQNEAYKIGMSAVSAIENIFWEVFKRSCIMTYLVNLSLKLIKGPVKHICILDLFFKI